MTYAISLRAFTNSISDNAFEQLCRENPELRFETDARGKLIITPPTGSESGRKNSSLLAQIWHWNSQSKLGEVFDSSTGFKLSNGATRSPDVSWIEIGRWNGLSDEQKRGFAPIDPDFVIELMSPNDDLATAQQKMAEYIDCGIKLGWLINPDQQMVEIYRPSSTKLVFNNPRSLSDDDILPGLNLDLSTIF